jgi:hypothetical protein
MASQKETANIVFLLLAVGSVGLLAAAGGKAKTDPPGTVKLSGEQESGTGQLYSWRVVTSAAGAGAPFTGLVKVAGFGGWDTAEAVSEGQDADQARLLAIEHIALA